LYRVRLLTSTWEMNGKRSYDEHLGTDLKAWWQVEFVGCMTLCDLTRPGVQGHYSISSSEKFSSIHHSVPDLAPRDYPSFLHAKKFLTRSKGKLRYCEPGWRAWWRPCFDEGIQKLVTISQVP